MLTRYLSIGIAVFFTSVSVASVCAEEYILQYKALDLLAQEGIYAESYARPTKEPEEALSAEPEYASEMPIYLTVAFGGGLDNTYTIVLDESKGAGRGYDTLYVDRNNNEDLTDDRKITGRTVDEFGRTTGNFDAEVLVDYDDVELPYIFSLEYYRYGELSTHFDSWSGKTYIQNIYFYVWAGGYYTGSVGFGGIRRSFAVIDYNVNGLFDEYFEPPHYTVDYERTLYATGDQVLIDANGNGRFEGGYRDNYKELYPYARYLPVNGRWYFVDISADGRRVEVETPNLKLGTIRIPGQLGSCTLQLVSSNGILKFDETGKDVQVPADTYQLYSYTAEVKHSSGVWRYDAQGTTSGKKFQVKEGDVAPLEFGSPLLVNIRYSYGQPVKPKVGDTIQLSLTLSGQGGETYTSILKDGLRPPVPTFKVVDETEKTVAKGAFKYG